MNQKQLKQLEKDHWFCFIYVQKTHKATQGIECPYMGISTLHMQGVRDRQTETCLFVFYKYMSKNMTKVSKIYKAHSFFPRVELKNITKV